MKLSRRERDLLARALGIGGALAASEQPAYLELLRKILDRVEVEPLKPDPPLRVPRTVRRSTA